VDVWPHTKFHFSGALATTVKSNICTAAFYRIRDVDKTACSSYMTLRHSRTFN
jgi:hypothetical protein